MVITKTKFINYLRCPRYCALETIKSDEFDADLSFDEYQKEEEEALINEMLGRMMDETGESLIEKVDEQLETMLPYYNKVEELALKQVKKKLGGEPIPNELNPSQEGFDYLEKGVKYLCYVDIYIPRDKGFEIVEVKGTTSGGFLKLGPTIKKEHYSIFKKNEHGIYQLKGEFKDELDLPLAKYLDFKSKLSDRYHGCGRYVYDLLVQRMIVEGYLKENNDGERIDLGRYYLAVLNSDYVFPGNYNDMGEPIYEKDANGNDVIVLFDFTALTKELLAVVKADQELLYQYIMKMEPSPCPLGKYCEHKKVTSCKYLEVCFYDRVPKENSILNYFNSSYGFKDENGEKVLPFTLINEGIVRMLELEPFNLTRPNNLIQREVVLTNNPYIDKDKIRVGLKQLEYPLYHLDFETFPCPLPRFKGEKCYTQSVFQFSLHIEREPGVCDFNLDHYEFLASDHQDWRQEIARLLCTYIDPNKGTIIAYNQGFEKARLRELGVLFPEYAPILTLMQERMFDLLYLVKNNTKLYKELGFKEDSAHKINYYHPALNGSYSIKKVLPVLVPSLTYQGLDVGNGTEALVTYAQLPSLTKDNFKLKYQALLDYCKQDTWAMVVILAKLRTLVKLD